MGGEYPKKKHFGNEQPCDECGKTPTRVFYGKEKEDDIFLCYGCAKCYCKECHRLFSDEHSLKIHRGKIHREEDGE